MRYLKRALALLVGVMNDPAVEPSVRVQAAGQICDRFGLQRRHELEADGPATVDLLAVRSLMTEAMRDIMSETKDLAVEPIVADFELRSPGENGAGSGAH